MSSLLTTFIFIFLLNKANLTVKRQIYDINIDILYSILYTKLFRSFYPLTRNQNHRRKTMRRIDPFYFLLRYSVLRGLFLAKLTPDERAFVDDNLNKHRKAWWIAALCTFPLVSGIWGLDQAARIGLLTGLLGPVVVLGGAWFAVSFGGVPVKLLAVAMTITFWMYVAFKTAFVTMYLALLSVTPFTPWPVLPIILVGTFWACEQYDTTDGL